jgi:hypothetical protein
VFFLFLASVSSRPANAEDAARAVVHLAPKLQAFPAELLKKLRAVPASGE